MIEIIEKIVVDYLNDTRDKNIRPYQLHEKTRKGEIVEIRQYVFYFFFEKSINKKNSDKTAGVYYGLDRATSIHGRKRIQNLCDVDKQIRAEIEEINNIIDNLDLTPRINKNKLSVNDVYQEYNFY